MLRRTSHLFQSFRHLDLNFLIYPAKKFPLVQRDLKKSAKLYSDDQFDDLSNLVEENIKIAGNTIISGDFSINPKQIDKVNKSCEYCKYAAICYRRNDDIKHYSTKEEQ